MITAVVFDMDGVLIDAREWHYEALNTALNHFGYSISRTDHIARFDGLPTREKLTCLTTERGLPHGLHGLINDIKQAATVDLVYRECKPRFEHEYLLRELRSSGIKLGLASNSIRASIDLMLSRANIADYFDVILSNEDVRHAKPAPDIYIEALRLLGSRAEETLVVEDNDHGVAAARAAGCHVLQVAEISEVTYRHLMAKIEEVNS